SCLDPFAVSCISQNDAVSKFGVFTCSNSNCSINGRLISESVCVNVSSYQRNCCCYGDGCNNLAFSMDWPSNSTTTPINSLNNAASSSTPPKTLTSGALKCLQGLQNTTLSSTIVPTLCTDPLAVTCRTQI
uniref:UPAR/Ly6 domain-containing protein n=1 Tax=Panagrolaimus sp. PS1159 TaxID=55785 RepID=A0AC35ET61_9BILA